MKVVLYALAGMLLSVTIAALVWVLAFVTIVKFVGGPYSPLIPLSFVFALAALIISEVLWQRRVKARLKVR